MGGYQPFVLSAFGQCTIAADAAYFPLTSFQDNKESILLLVSLTTFSMYVRMPVHSKHQEENKIMSTDIYSLHSMDISLFINRLPFRNKIEVMSKILVKGAVGADMRVMRRQSSNNAKMASVVSA